MISSRIAGIGRFVPPRKVGNADLEEEMNTTDAWIVERTGIHERRWVEKGKGHTSATMGAMAAKEALKHAGIRREDVDFIVFATLSPDYYFPGCGVQLQHLLGLDTVGALDVRNQCSGFLYALSAADHFIKAGTYKNILVVGAEVQSLMLDKSDKGRHVSVIFGDGAGAVLLSAVEGQTGILSSVLHTQGLHAEELALVGPNPQYWVNDILDGDNPMEDPVWRAHMNGNFVFKNAVVRMSEAVEEVLEKAGLAVVDIDLLIPHQANLRISSAVQKRLGLGDNQVYNNIMRYGNTTAASIPIALSEAVEEGKLKPGDILVLVAFGSGFTWAASVVRW